ncbi:hypothetical protein BV22DRAFT_1129558 [Leucogyrophana mollusca]|uniref:Uncharacterized protein n=1 Tax=Leucogyrophana mollusca TaxID=85980 RepID=A0ACB8BGW3_9AGAM|nr:hypothetical protein BV22DRAFT_1129558 [Leucogyrophana mollusca]
MVIELLRDDVDDLALWKRLESIASDRDSVAKIAKCEPKLTLFRKALENAKNEVKLTGVTILENLASHGDLFHSVHVVGGKQCSFYHRRH